MDKITNRITAPDCPPTDVAVARWIGERGYIYWKQLTHLIDDHYPGVFTPEWLYGGKKHGWSLRYKKSKSFCTLIPEKNRLALLIVFGSEERARFESIRNDVSHATSMHYDEATTYHDGTWLLLDVNDDSVVRDVMLLLAVKRKPRHDHTA
jgi:hypothetical protein